MEAKLAQFGNKGMYKDTSISKSSNEYAYENKNVRITVGDEESLLSVTNEKLPSVQNIIIKKELTKNVLRIVPKGPSGRGKPVDPEEHLRVRIASQYESKSNVPMMVECSFGRINGVFVWDEHEQKETEYNVSLFGQYEESHVFIWGIKSSYGGETLYVLKDENDPNLKQTDTICKKVSVEDSWDYNYENDYYAIDEDLEFPQRPFIYEFTGTIYRSNVELDKDGFTQIVQNVSKTYPINTSETIILKEELAQDISYDPGSDYTSIDVDPGYFDLSATGLTVDYIGPDNVFHYVDENNDSEEDIEFSTINGTYIGHCLTSDYLVLFVKATESGEQVDYIYRLEKATDGEHDFLAQQLFKGYLEFSEDNPIETLFYYESEDVQKVYWIDGKHQTRVINIKKNDYVTDLNTQFDFVPSVSGTPTVKISKKFDATGNFHSGVIQYFITYYNKFGAETGIVWSSVLHYIAPEDRGGAPDEFVSCSFELELKDLDQNFEYARIYSLKRQSLDGPTELNVVKDFRIKNKSTIKIIDTGANQETLDSNYIYYIGGSNFIAETFAQKDDTLFLGNIKINDEELSVEIKNYIKEHWIGRSSRPQVDEPKNNAKRIHFDYKCFSEEEPNKFYPHNQQINLSSLAFKGFKYGETYRFAIQYKTKYGKWTEPVWIGDKKCNIFPKRLQDTNQVAVPTAVFTIDPDDTEYQELVSEYLGYRILMAKTDFTTRNVVAQGIISPTMFNYDQRIKGKPYSMASYIMRPRWGNAEHRHFYPVSEIFGTNKLMLPENISDASAQGSGDIHVRAVFTARNEFNIPAWWGYKSSIDFYVYRDDDGVKTDPILVTWANGSSNYACNKAYLNIGNLLKKLGSPYSENYLSRETHDKLHLNSISVGQIIDGWKCITKQDGGLYRVFEKDIQVGSSDHVYLLYEDILLKDQKTSASFDNEFYVDESIVTFNSPEIELNLNQIDNSNLNFRIVGIAPITANKSDFDLKFTEESHTGSSGEILNVPDIYKLNNISEHAITLIRDYLYNGPTMTSSAISSLDKYDISMWHHSGSVSGAYNTIGTQKVYIDNIESNKFSTERFSICTEYFRPQTYSTSKISVFNYDGVSMCKIPLTSGDGTYYGNYNNVIVPKNPITITREKIDSLGDSLKTTDPTQIAYKSTPHAVFSLIGKNSGEDDSLENIFHLLPRISSDLTRRQEDLKDYTEYSFIWNDTENIDPRSIQDEKQKIYCVNVVRIPGYIQDEHDVKNYLYTKVYDRVSAYLSGEINCVLGSYDNPSVINPKISFSFKVVPNSGRLDVDEKIEDIEDYAIILRSSLNDYPLPITKKIDGILKSILYNVDSNTKILQDSIPTETLKYVRCQTINYSCKYPYLFIGELYRNLPYETLYGGYDENAIENITWIPASGEAHIYEDINKMEGDTYFQRWDCVKTTPLSNGGINSIFDITSVMLESHICLDGRFDRNRGGDNILDINEDNFNLLNDAYSQSNNVFQYNILDDKYDLDTFKNQVVWSNQKSPTSDVDTWTNISQLSSLYLNGEYGPINKLVNFNDNILAFQDKAISTIKFNNNIQVSTEQGLPIEVVNSNKVTGYDVVSRVNGCHNKWSIHQTSGGLYFIDDYNKALFRFNKDGLSNISLSAGFSKWFKDNITGDVWKPGSKKEFRISSDQITHDVYIIRNSTSENDLACLAYNEDTQTFTSFYPIYRDSVSMFNLTGDSFYLGKDLNVYKMFDGDYCRDFYVEYNINPEPLENKIFTNIEYVADTIKLSGLNAGLQKVNPFAELYVETEYQSGLTNLLRQTYPNGLAKFRVWRADIPRGSGWSTGNKLNRIQNPWIKLRLTGTSEDYLEGITTLHSLTVKYFK